MSISAYDVCSWVAQLTSTAYPDLGYVPVQLSSDHGRTWHPLPAPVPAALDLGSEGVEQVAAAVNGSDIVLVDDDVVVSTDGGAHWAAPELPAGCHPSTLTSAGPDIWLPCNPTDPTIATYAASDDGGRSWTLRRGPQDGSGEDSDTQVGTSGLVVTTADPPTGETFWQSTDDGLTWHREQPALPVDPTDLPVTD